MDRGEREKDLYQLPVPLLVVVQFEKNRAHLWRRWEEGGPAAAPLKMKQGRLIEPRGYPKLFLESLSCKSNMCCIVAHILLARELT